MDDEFNQTDGPSTLPPPPNSGADLPAPPPPAPPVLLPPPPLPPPPVVHAAQEVESPSVSEEVEIAQSAELAAASREAEAAKERKALEKAEKKEQKAVDRAGKRETLDARSAAAKDRRASSGVIGNATYCGGLPEAPRKATGNLIWDDEKIGVGTMNAKKGIVRWDEVASITTDSDQIAKRKTGAIVMFGVLGGLGGRATQERSELAVTRHDGATAYFELDKISKAKLRGKLGPSINRRGLRFADEESRGPAQPTTVIEAPSLADELSKLAGLRDQGILSEDEFNEAKARLISGG